MCYKSTLRTIGINLVPTPKSKIDNQPHQQWFIAIGKNHCCIDGTPATIGSQGGVVKGYLLDKRGQQWQQWEVVMSRVDRGLWDFEGNWQIALLQKYGVIISISPTWNSYCVLLLIVILQHSWQALCMMRLLVYRCLSGCTPILEE